MRKQRIKSNRLCFLIVLFMVLFLTGCGSDDSGNPVVPLVDPVKYEKVDVTFKPGSNIASFSGINAVNIAVDVPADSDYLINIENKGAKVKIELAPSVNNTADVRASVAGDIDSALENFERNLALKASLQAKLNFIKSAKAQKNNSRTASLRFSADTSSIRQSNHSDEKIGECYPIQIGNVNPNSDVITEKLIVLKNCKLFWETAHAKFFVDQDSHEYNSSYVSQMENLITKTDGFAETFENIIYPVLKEKFGTVADVDGDKKLSILFSCILPKMSCGLQGLFPYETMILDPDDYCIDPINPITDFRDLVIIAPILEKAPTEAFHIMMNNLIHETQHAVNFSQRTFNGNSYKKFDIDCFCEELGFDEGMSVCAEALFRRACGQNGFPMIFEYRYSGLQSEYAGNTNRFNDYQLTNLFPFDENNFNHVSDYGRNGLFMLYLHDRFGETAFKSLIQQGWKGSKLETSIPECLGYKNSLDALQKDWHLAVQNEYLRTETRNFTEESFGKDFAYNDWLNLKSKNKYFYEPVFISNSEPVFFRIEAQNNSGSYYRFFIKSSDEKTSLRDLTVKLVKNSQSNQ